MSSGEESEQEESSSSVLSILQLTLGLLLLTFILSKLWRECRKCAENGSFRAAGRRANNLGMTVRARKEGNYALKCWF